MASDIHARARKRAPQRRCRGIDFTRVEPAVMPHVRPAQFVAICAQEEGGIEKEGRREKESDRKNGGAVGASGHAPGTAVRLRHPLHYETGAIEEF